MPMLGLREFEAALNKVVIQGDAVSRQAVAAAAAIAERDAKNNFEGAHKRGEPHVGGDKPNVVTGTLRRSITTDPIRRYGLGSYGTVVAPRANYARRVELGWPDSDGTRGHNVTRPYPYFEPAADHAREELPDLAAAMWRRFLA
ncbi:MAG: HK97 gp10 family phage protein [Jatrophihabitans sp.]|uniref:HK97 gp10 family phage protein n=1 Tax=Jatrophihabitans sp. TaxID=1932789 RepID=UPI003F7E612C